MQFSIRYSILDLSIIVAAYNVEKYIEQCISSISIDGDIKYEVIVINDGSTDRTLDILNSISNENIKIITINNSGVSNVRNLGIKQARGKYIFFVDGDDTLNIVDFIDLFNKNSKSFDVIIGSYIDHIDENYYKNSDNSGVESELDGISTLDKYFLNGITPSIWKAFYKKEFLLKNNLFFLNDIVIAEDAEWLIKVLYQAESVYLNTDLYVYNYRINQYSVMKSKFGHAKFASIIFVINKLLDLNVKNIKIINFYIMSLILSALSQYEDKITLKEVKEIKNIASRVKYYNFKSFIFLKLLMLDPRLIQKIYKYFK